MPPENLNIEWHTKRLVLKALNKYRHKYEAAAALGISAKGLNDYICRFNVVLHNGEYSIKGFALRY